MKSQVPWLRVFVEGVVIVGSILLAFGIQAWWDGVQEDERLRSVLVGIEAEFRTNRDYLDYYQGKHVETAEAGRRILALTGPDAEAPDDVDAFERDLYWVLGWWIFTAEWGQLTSLVTSGDLGLIRDDSLRVALGVWPDKVRELNRVEEMQQLYAETIFIPLVQGHVPIRQAISAGVPDFVDRGSFPTDYRALLRDVEFESAVTNRVWSVATIVGLYDPIRDSLDDIATRLDPR